MKKQVALLVLFLMSCKQGASFDANVQDVAQKKSGVTALTTLDLTSETQYAAISDYFRTISDLALSLKTDPNAKTYLEAQTKGKQLSGFCSRFILTVAEWRSLNSQCIVGGSYLCPDEVREYSTIVHVIEGSLPAPLKKEFNNNLECSKWATVN